MEKGEQQTAVLQDCKIEMNAICCLKIQEKQKDALHTFAIVGVLHQPKTEAQTLPVFKTQPDSTQWILSDFRGKLDLKLHFCFIYF